MARSFHITRSLIAVTFLTAGAGIPILAQGGFEGPGRYEISNLKSGKVIDLDRNDQTTVIQFSSRRTDNQAWDVIRADSGYYFLRNAMNGYALEPAGDRDSAPLRGTPFNGSPMQQWRIERGKDGNAILINRNGKVIDLPDGTSRDGARLQIYGENGDSNQRFIFRRLAGFRPPEDRGARGDRDDRDHDHDRDHDRDDRQTGRYFDDRDRMWKMRGDGVCFYRDRDFRGDAFCARVGDQITNVGPQWNDSFSSVKFFGRTRSVEIYENENYGGDHVRLRNDEPDLGRYRTSRGSSFSHRVTSFRVN